MQTIDDIKKRLLKHIENVESVDFLIAIEEIVFHISRESDDFELSESDIAELERRREDYLSGKIKAISLEEFKIRFFEKHGI